MADAAHNDNRVVVLCDDSDLTITVMNSTGERESYKHFKVSREVVKSKSEYFEASLKFKEAHEHNIVLQNENALAMHVWLKHMHVETDYKNKNAWRGPRGLYSEVDVAVLWHVIRVGDKYVFDGEILRGFFAAWYARNVDIDNLREEFARALALPCFCFDHAEGFAAITKWLAYNCDGHITEKKPVKFRREHQHLAPPDFVGPMNHARGGLKTSIHRELWKEVGSLLKRRYCVCGHWEATAGRYFSELVRTGAYPLETTYGKHSTSEVLSMLENFTMAPFSGRCSSCAVDWEDVVERAVRCTKGYFSGLCLDCMDRSLAKRENTDKDYWEHNESVGGRWDQHCRIKHGEPTWYVSWRGRDETRQKLIKSHREKARE